MKPPDRREQGKGDDDGSQHNMRDQDEVVNARQNPAATIRSRFGQRVVGEIRYQEECGRRKSGKDEIAVPDDVFTHNHDQRQNEKHEGESVQYCVKLGQIRVVFSGVAHLRHKQQGKHSAVNDNS